MVLLHITTYNHRNQKEKICKALLEEKERLALDVNIKDNNGNTFLHLLVKSCTTWFIHNVSYSLGSSLFALTATALKKGTGSSKMTFPIGANPNRQNNSGNTPLHLFFMQEVRIPEYFCKIILLLLDRSANPNIPNKYKMCFTFSCQ